MVATEQHADGRVGQRIDNYTKYWEKDPGQEGETHSNNRVGSYSDVVNGSFFFFCSSYSPVLILYFFL